MRTIQNCHFGIIVNGVAKGFIHSEHGLRQGDPLSLALFVLAGEYLSRGLNDLFKKNPSLYFDTKKGLQVSHLAYADDLILFTKGSKDGLKKIMNLFRHYEAVSGQKVNLTKSNCMCGIMLTLL